MAKIGGRAVCFLLLALGILVAVIVLASILAPRGSSCPSRSYPTAAVAADSRSCSDIGRDILERGGSAVDAAIAALVCTCVLNPQSMGLGGGVIFTVYDASTGEVEVINARETVPEASPRNLQERCRRDQPLGKGVYWIGIPGELRGYQLAHRRHGRLPWAQLFKPTIRLLREGFRVPKVLSAFLNSSLSLAINSSSLRQLFFRGQKPLAEGELLQWPALARTLEAVAEKGADELYEGALAEDLLADLALEGSQLTKEDLAGFRPEVVKPLALNLGNYTLYSPPPPAGGAILSFVLNVLQGFRFSQDALAQLEGKVSTYHRIVETLKFANGLRWKLRDPRSYPEAPDIYKELLTEELAQEVRDRIGPRGDHAPSYYNVSARAGPEAGTSHVAVLGADGSAVSATSTINIPFGSMVYSPKTGLILNNQLLDFCWRETPGSSKLLDPVPGERPPSSMVPSILISKDQKSLLVIGGSGGQMIIPATALAIVNNLWFGLNLHDAIKAKILHVRPTTKLLFEPGFDEEIKNGLIRRGHEVEEVSFWLNVVQAVAKDGPGCIHAESDLRKLGEAAGY
ncbi:glutathione hydrolase 5 proenzyme [Antechinus flavipes]|uniref:glutathione hydrolase 5 proenzyme n=1 Tax=Antechinus flavipes TaxID=38775 RepID=UPI002235949A|nr:glutathione hydrolase 5 proenzyme [Antechinus flavipes]